MVLLRSSTKDGELMARPATLLACLVVPNAVLRMGGDRLGRLGGRKAEVPASSTLSSARQRDSRPPPLDKNMVTLLVTRMGMEPRGWTSLEKRNTMGRELKSKTAKVASSHNLKLYDEDPAATPHNLRLGST